jgi:hypothetical protein
MEWVWDGTSGFQLCPGYFEMSITYPCGDIKQATEQGGLELREVQAVIDILESSPYRQNVES